MSVYLLHFDKPYHHAKHYIGYAVNVEERIADHAAGRGARLMAVINEAGITFQVARVWEGANRRFERKLKRRKNAPRLCPICKQKVSSNE